ncbi:hypothetical protein BDV12DRAFT_191175 [Aspergillus spectabilis]
MADTPSPKWNCSYELLLEALGLCEQHFGPDHAQKHRAQTFLAYNYRVQGRYQESEVLEENMPSKAKRLDSLPLGEDGIVTMSSMNNLGNTYSDHGRPSEAAGLHGGVLKSRSRILGTNNLLIIASMGLLAADSQSLSPAVDAAKLSLGEAHETTIRCMSMAHANSLLEQALELARRGEQEDSPLTMGITDDLAAAYIDVKRLEEAKPVLISCLEWAQRMLGRD